MPYRPRDVQSTLQSKFGFEPARTHSSDHPWYVLRLDGLPDILTKVSHGRREIPLAIESKIAKQCRVRGPFFRGMMDCSNSREDYYQQVREDPFPPFYIRF